MKLRTCNKTCIVIAAFLLTCAGIHGAIIQDSTFNNADWNAAKVLDTTPGAAASFSALQVASGGNPGAYRQVTHTLEPGAIRVAHLLNIFYNPAVEGRISGIDYAYDLLNTSALAGTVVGYTPLLLQNGSYYGLALSGTPDQDGITIGGWTHFERFGLVASQFANYTSLGSGGANPDFSTSGAPIQIGYMSTNTGTDPGTTTSGIDNFMLVVIPEPRTFGLLIMGCLIFAFRQRGAWTMCSLPTKVGGGIKGGGRGNVSPSWARRMSSAA